MPTLPPELAASSQSVRAIAFGNQYEVRRTLLRHKHGWMLEMLPGTRKRPEFAGALHFIPAKYICPGSR
jgi:hypothetical protein